jgi:hypothetical protein
MSLSARCFAERPWSPEHAPCRAPRARRGDHSGREVVVRSSPNYVSRLINAKLIAAGAGDGRALEHGDARAAARPHRVNTRRPSVMLAMQDAVVMQVPENGRVSTPVDIRQVSSPVSVPSRPIEPTAV